MLWLSKNTFTPSPKPAKGSCSAAGAPEREPVKEEANTSNPEKKLE